MKTAKLIVIAVLMLLIATAAIAQQSVKMDYTDSYNWHGIKIYGDDTVHLGVATSMQGIDISAISHIGQNHDDIEYWDTSVGYALPPLAGLQITPRYGYMILPGTEAQEFSLTAQLPGMIAPRYTIAHVELSEGDGGQFHVVGCDVSFGDPNGLQAMLMADITYNDGVLGIEDWTHAMAGLVVDIPIGPVSIQPGVWYQYSFTPEVLNCKENEVWYGLSVIARF